MRTCQEPELLIATNATARASSLDSIDDSEDSETESIPPEAEGKHPEFRSNADEIPTRFRRADPNFDALKQFLKHKRQLPGLSKNEQTVVARQSRSKKYKILGEKLMFRRQKAGEWLHHIENSAVRKQTLENIHEYVPMLCLRR